MIAYLKRRLFFSGVQAELKAQINDQGFVNRVCQTPEATQSILEKWYPLAGNIKPSNMKFFVVVCAVLSDRLREHDVAETDLEICAQLLEQRCEKILTSPNLMASVGASMAVWMAELQSFQS